MPDPLILVGLFAVVLVMAAVSASIGPAGGVVFAAMAIALPAPAVVPVHAAVQAGGTSIRLRLLRDFVSVPTMVAFSIGGIVGFLPAALLISRVEIDPAVLRCGLGLATLAPLLVGGSRSGGGAEMGSTERSARWPDGRAGPGSGPASGRVSALAGPRTRRLVALGGVTSFAALFVGATGAMVGAMLSRFHHDPRERAATHTGCLWLQHLAKVAIYWSLGFSLAEYLPLVALLLTASAIGALVGRRILLSVSPLALTAVFEIVILGLGAYLVATALGALWLVAA